MVKKSVFAALAGVLVLSGAGCGGPSEKDKNPNPGLEYSKEGPPKRGGGVPSTTPKGAKESK